MSRVIFRKIGGRLVPITISVEQQARARIIKAHAVDKIGAKVKVGELVLSIPQQGNHAILVHTKVEPHFRRRGIGNALFNHSLETMGSEGKKFIRSDAIIHPAQVRIRSRKNTKFVGKGMGIHEKESKLLTNAKAFEGAKKISMGKNQKTTDPRNIIATTMIPKKFRRK